MFSVSALMLTLTTANATPPVPTLEAYLQERTLHRELLNKAPYSTNTATLQAHSNVAVAASIPELHVANEITGNNTEEYVLPPNPNGRRSEHAVTQPALAKQSQQLSAQSIQGSYFLFNDLEINTNLSTGRLTFEAATGHIQLTNGGSTFDWHIDNENFVIITPHDPILVMQSFVFVNGSIRQRLTYIDTIEFRYETAANGTARLIGDQLYRYSYPGSDLADETFWTRFDNHAVAKTAKVALTTLIPTNKTFSLPFRTENSTLWYLNGQERSFSSTQNNLLVNLFKQNEANPQNLEGRWGVYTIDSNGELEFRSEQVEVTFNPDGSATFIGESGKTANVFVFKRPSDQALIYNVQHAETTSSSAPQSIARESISFTKNPQLSFAIPGIYQVRQNQPLSLWWLEFNEDGTAMQVMYNYVNNRHSTLAYRWQYGSNIQGPYIEARTYQYHSASGKTGYCMPDQFEPSADSICKLSHSEVYELFDIKMEGTQKILQTNRYFTTFNNTFGSTINETKKIYGSSSVSKVSYNILSERPVPFPTQTPINSETFSDQRLQNCINSSGKTYLEEITTLYCSGVQDLKGIDKLVNLEEVILYGQSWNATQPWVLTDLSPLIKLNRVRTLILESNDLSNEALQTLTGFKFASYASTIELGIGYNRLTEASLPFINSLLSGFNQNVTLRVNNNHFKHVNGLASLPGLFSVSIGSNPLQNVVQNINQFTNTDLKVLSIQNLSISNFTEITLPNNLIALDISSNPISSLNTLLPKLNPETLDLLNITFTQINDLSGLEIFNKLSSLTLSFTPISDISILAKMTNLRFLDLNGAKVSNIDPLMNLTNLVNVAMAKLYQVKCEDIAKLEQQTTVRRPDMCKIDNLTYQLLKYFGQDVSGVSLIQDYQHLGQIAWQNGVLTFTPSPSATGIVELQLSIQTLLGANWIETLFVDTGRKPVEKSKRRGLPAWLYLLDDNN
ncbi:leucine-rich repeat domain-containing protein [Alishewanella longhuensis]